VGRELSARPRGGKFVGDYGIDAAVHRCSAGGGMVVRYAGTV